MSRPGDERVPLLSDYPDDFTDGESLLGDGPYSPMSFSGDENVAPYSPRNLSGDENFSPYSPRNLSGDENFAPYSPRNLSGDEHFAPYSPRNLSGDENFALQSPGNLPGDENVDPQSPRNLPGDENLVLHDADKEQISEGDQLTPAVLGSANKIDKASSKKPEKPKPAKKKKRKKYCPKFVRSIGREIKKVWFSDSNQFMAVKSLVTFPTGLLLGFAFKSVVLSKFELKEETNQLVSAVSVFLISVGFTASVRIRCVLSLVIPLFFGKGGRSYVSTFAIMYLISGPVTNLIWNAKETMNMLTCMTQLMMNLTGNKYKLRTDPIKQSLREIQSRGFYIKEIVGNLKNAYKPIKREIQEEPEVVHLIDETEKVDNYRPKKERRPPRVDQIEKQTEGDDMFSRMKKIELRWQRKINFRCEGVFNQAIEKCRMWFHTAEETCMSMFSIFGYLLCIPMKLSVLCNVVRVYTGVLGLKCDAANVMNPGVGETYGAADNMMNGLDKNFEVNMQYKVMNPDQDLNYMSAEHARKTTMHKFEEKARIMNFILIVMKRFLAFTFIIVFRSAFLYHKHWVADFRYDNIYITAYFRHIDARRQAQGKRTLLPLKKIEEKILIYPWKPSLMSSETSNFKSSSLLILFRVFISGLVIFMDYVLYMVLDLLNRHSRVDYQQKGEHKIKFTVFGTGYLQYVVRLFLESFNKHYKLDKTNTNVDCLPKPMQLSLYEMSIIFSIYFVVWVLLYLEAYAMRTRRLFSAFYYRRREKRRVLYLYNDLLKRRIGLLRHMRKKVRKLAKEQKLSEKTGILYALKKTFPKMCGCLNIFAASRTYCLICKTPEIPGNFHNCETPGCNFGYCRQCWRDVKRKCYACMESYNTDSEESSDDDDDDDDDKVFD